MNCHKFLIAKYGFHLWFQGCKPPAADPIGRSASPSPCSSYQPSPRASYNSSSFPSSGSSSQIMFGGGSGFFGGVEGSSLIPWLRNLSSPGGSHFASSSKFPVHHHRPYYFNGGSISAPVTPPLGSPPRTPRLKTGGLGEYPGHFLPPWAGASYASLPNSTPPSPDRKVTPDPAWLAGFQISSAGPSSPTYSLVAPTYNPFASSSRMCTPGQSGTCSPVVGGTPMAHGDVEMIDGAGHEFAFGSGGDVGDKMPGLVKPWEGERIHEECVSDELELTLGSSRTRADHP